MSETATVEVLSAEVRVLMVGSRQVTLSVYGQLDCVPVGACAVFGRVRTKDSSRDVVEIVGVTSEGILCSSWLSRSRHSEGYSYRDIGGRYMDDDRGSEEWERLANFPLIVLAGLR